MLKRAKEAVAAINREQRYMRDGKPMPHSLRDLALDLPFFRQVCGPLAASHSRSAAHCACCAAAHLAPSSPFVMILLRVSHVLLLPRRRCVAARHHVSSRCIAPSPHDDASVPQVVRRVLEDANVTRESSLAAVASGDVVSVRAELAAAVLQSSNSASVSVDRAPPSKPGRLRAATAAVAASGRLVQRGGRAGDGSTRPGSATRGRDGAVTRVWAADPHGIDASTAVVSYEGGDAVVGTGAGGGVGGVGGVATSLSPQGDAARSVRGDSHVEGPSDTAWLDEFFPSGFAAAYASREGDGDASSRRRGAPRSAAPPGGGAVGGGPASRRRPAVEPPDVVAGKPVPVRVFARVRPLLPWEEKARPRIVAAAAASRRVTVDVVDGADAAPRAPFNFDEAFDGAATQADVFRVRHSAGA